MGNRNPLSRSLAHGTDVTDDPAPHGPGKENDYALESVDGYILWCCWKLKRKFRLMSARTDLCGGRSAMLVPTATASSQRMVQTNGVWEASVHTCTI